MRGEKHLSFRGLGGARLSLRFDPSDRSVSRGKQRLVLDRRSFEVLSFLAKRPGQVVSKEELIKEVWDGLFVSDDVVTKAIKNIRRALGTDTIQTTRGLGYELVVMRRGTPPTGGVMLALCALTTLAIVIGVAWSGVVGPTENTVVAVDDFGCMSSRRDDCDLASLINEVIRTDLATRSPGLISGAERGGERRRSRDITVEGSLFRNGDALQLAVRAVDSATGRYLWATRREVRSGTAEATAETLVSRLADQLKLPQGGARPVLPGWPVPNGEPGSGSIGEVLAFAGVSDYQPSWSPDGRSVAFISDRLGKNQLFVAEEGEPRLVPLPSALSDPEDPTWSPDGSALAFSGALAGNRDVFVFQVGVERENLRRVTSHPGPDFQPAWMPDGKELIFSSSRNEGIDLFRIQVSGGEPRSVTRSASRNLEASVSPDGALIAFSSDRSAEGGWAVYVMDLEKQETRLVTPSVARASNPRWSPDGGTLVFKSEDRRGDTDLYLLNVDTGEYRSLVADGRSVHQPSWSPDGRRLMFHVKEGAGRNIYVRDLSDDDEVILFRS